MPKQITLDELAIMINNGFKEQSNDLSKVRNDVSEFKHETMARFDRLDKRFDSLEEVVFNDHGRRLRKIENKLAIA